MSILIAFVTITLPGLIGIYANHRAFTTQLNNKMQWVREENNTIEQTNQHLIEQVKQFPFIHIDED